MLNGIISLLSISDLSVLVCRNITHFLCFVLSSSTIKNSLMSSSSFLVASLRFSIHSIMSYENWDFCCLFSSLDSFYFIFFCLPWLGLPKVCWKEVERMGILVLFLTLEEMLSAFHHWEWRLLWVCHIWPLLCWGRFPLCSLSGQFLSKIEVEFVKNFYIYEIIYFFYSAVC